jgi:hypothetical protein
MSDSKEDEEGGRFCRGNEYVPAFVVVVLVQIIVFGPTQIYSSAKLQPIFPFLLAAAPFLSLDGRIRPHCTLRLGPTSVHIDRKGRAKPPPPRPLLVCISVCICFFHPFQIIITHVHQHNLWSIFQSSGIKQSRGYARDYAIDASRPPSPIVSSSPSATVRWHHIEIITPHKKP